SDDSWPPAMPPHQRAVCMPIRANTGSPCAARKSSIHSARSSNPHHHLWDRGSQRYLIEEITDDIASGHNIVATVYVDCRSMYRADGPEALRPVGEVEFANGVAAMAASGGYGKAALCAGI